MATKEDLRQFGIMLVDNLRTIVEQSCHGRAVMVQPEWLKTKAVRKLLDISAGSVQNLRITGEVRFRKVLGSYYYNKEDLQKLFL